MPTTCTSANVYDESDKFTCPRYPWDVDKTFCCGTYETRYCCTEAEYRINTSLLSPEYDEYIENVVHAVTLTLLLLAVVSVCFCCVCCPCCPAHGWHKRRGRVIRTGSAIPLGPVRPVPPQRAPAEYTLHPPPAASGAFGPPPAAGHSHDGEYFASQGPGWSPHVVPPAAHWQPPAPHHTYRDPPPPYHTVAGNPANPAKHP